MYMKMLKIYDRDPHFPEIKKVISSRPLRIKTGEWFRITELL